MLMYNTEVLDNARRTQIFALAAFFFDRIGVFSEHSHAIMSLLPENQAWPFPVHIKTVLVSPNLA